MVIIYPQQPCKGGIPPGWVILLEGQNYDILKGTNRPDQVGPRVVSLISKYFAQDFNYIQSPYLMFKWNLKCYCIALQAQINLITNSFGGHQAQDSSYADFVQSSAVQCKNQPKSFIIHPLQLRKSEQLISKQNQLQFRHLYNLDQSSRKQKNLTASQAISNQSDLSSKCLRTLNSF